MELTWVAAASLLFAGVGYAFVQRAPRPRFVVWSLLCASLFALATRDLFRPREQNRPAAGATPSDAPADRDDPPTDLPDERPVTPDDTADADGERTRTPLFVRLRSRVAGWLG